MTLKCNNCEAEYTPKQRFCSANCRADHHYKSTKALNNTDKSTDTLNKSTVSLKPVTQSYQVVTVGPLEEEYPEGKCPKHGGLLALCHC